MQLSRKFKSSSDHQSLAVAREVEKSRVKAVPLKMRMKIPQQFLVDQRSQDLTHLKSQRRKRIPMI